MKSLFLLAALALAVGCGGTKKARTPDTLQPEFQQTKSYYEILDEDTRTRVGFVEKIEYETGRVVYWVTDPDRQLKYGYFLPNGSAYKFEWVGRRRSDRPRDLGADVYSVSARRILGHPRPIELEAITLEELLAERKPKPEPAEAKSEEGDAEEE
ncbi:MAG: hypothetical protein ACYTEZ_04585 [Planctomycetota bacterium]|jgi:hypothetical protein